MCADIGGAALTPGFSGDPLMGCRFLEVEYCRICVSFYAIGLCELLSVALRALLLFETVEFGELFISLRHRLYQPG